MARVEKRRKTDWFCTKCRRALVNDSGKRKVKDTVTARADEKTTYFIHDGCSGSVIPGG